MAVSSTADVEDRWGTLGHVGMKPLESGRFLEFFHYNVLEVVACIQVVANRLVTIVAGEGVFWVLKMTVDVAQLTTNRRQWIRNRYPYQNRLPILFHRKLEATARP